MGEGSKAHSFEGGYGGQEARDIGFGGKDALFSAQEVSLRVQGGCREGSGRDVQLKGRGLVIQ